MLTHKSTVPTFVLLILTAVVSHCYGRSASGVCPTEDLDEVEFLEWRRRLKLSMETPLSANSSCNNVLPWVEDIRAGVDLTYVEPLTKTQPLRGRILQWTCTGVNPKWNGYDVPDQIFITSQTSSSWQNSTWSASDAIDIKSKLSMTVGESVFFGLMSSSITLSDALELSLSASASFGYATYVYAAYVSRLAPTFLLRPSTELLETLQHFVGNSSSGTAVECVPFNESSVSGYNEVIKYFGTGFLSAVHFGGSALMEWAAVHTALNFMQSGDLAINADISLLDVISYYGGINFHEKVNVHFSESITRNYTSTIGGVGSPFQGNNSWGSWQTSVLTNPAIICMQTQNLSSLVLQASKSCGAELAKAETNYYVRHYLSGFVTTAAAMLQQYLNATVFPDCHFGNNTKACAKARAQSALSFIQSSIKAALTPPITSVGSAEVITGLLVADSLLVPPLPPKMKMIQMGGAITIAFAAMCGYNEIEVSHETAIGNTFMTLQIGTGRTPGGGIAEWTYSPPHNNDAGAGSCILYPIADGMVGTNGSVAVSVAPGGSGSIGTWWFCTLSTVQTGFNTNVGDAYVEVYRSTSSNEWFYSMSNHVQDVRGVSCLSEPSPGMPRDVTNYRNMKSGFSLGRHWWCVLSGTYHGLVDGNIFSSLSQDAKTGVWTYKNSAGMSSSAVCIG